MASMCSISIPLRWKDAAYNEHALDGAAYKLSFVGLKADILLESRGDEVARPCQ